jgi:hypothetical protein
MNSRTIRPARIAGVTGAAFLLAATAGGPAYAAAGDHPTGQRSETGKPASHNPTGNNGTVFVHDVAGDETPHDVPHVSCDFWVDLFGFDAGQEVTLRFAGQAPTGKGVELGGTWTGTAGDDDASGAGNDFDLEVPFSADDLGVTALGEPHPQQGYHVKLTVDTGEPGGHKYKVFWIEPCPVGETPGGETPGGETPGGETPGGETPDVEGTTTTRHHPRADVPTVVLGERTTRTPDTDVVALADTLPFTGSGAPVGLLTTAGLGGIAAGAALTVAGRRRRTTG